ncbi:MAG: hypothetical protein ACPKQO_10030 [Nitrososphaeraceae archaeon]
MTINSESDNLKQDMELITLNEVYNTLLKEFQINNLQEIPYDFYQKIANLLNYLKMDSDNILEKKMEIKLVELITEITNLLMYNRLEKILFLRNDNLNRSLEDKGTFYSRITDEEKYILNTYKEFIDKKEDISSMIVNGRSKYLEKISKIMRQKRVMVKFVKSIEAFIGVDMTKYGPFSSDDVANLPYENARSLIEEGIVSEIKYKLDN